MPHRDIKKKETEVVKTQTPATGSREPRYDTDVEQEAMQILTPTNDNRDEMSGKGGY